MLNRRAFHTFWPDEPMPPGSILKTCSLMAGRPSSLDEWGVLVVPSRFIRVDPVQKMAIAVANAEASVFIGE